jgi:hypothetical protein
VVAAANKPAQIRRTRVNIPAPAQSSALAPMPA